MVLSKPGPNPATRKCCFIRTTHGNSINKNHANRTAGKRYYSSLSRRNSPVRDKGDVFLFLIVAHKEVLQSSEHSNTRVVSVYHESRGIIFTEKLTNRYQ